MYHTCVLVHLICLMTTSNNRYYTQFLQIITGSEMLENAEKPTFLQQTITAIGQTSSLCSTLEVVIVEIEQSKVEGICDHADETDILEFEYEYERQVDGGGCREQAGVVQHAQ